MPTILIDHTTHYRYRRPVSFGEHRILTRPRESYDQRLLNASLVIDPEPSELRWVQDVFGNSVALASFDGEAAELSVRASAEVEHLPTTAEEIAIEPYAQSYPFTYSAEDMPDLLRSIERDYPDRGRRVDEWALRFLDRSGYTPTLDLLRTITGHIRSEFTYNRREEKGIQAPIETLELGSGTCRDFAVLMMEAVRALGFAARFVSGYLYSPEGGERRIGGRSTHAWLRIFIPGSGWIEFDPTNGICGNQGLIRVAITRDPEQAKPLSGTWSGIKGSSVDMSVDVRIKHAELETPHAAPGHIDEDIRC